MNKQTIDVIKAELLAAHAAIQRIAAYVEGIDVTDDVHDEIVPELPVSLRIGDDDIPVLEATPQDMADIADFVAGPMMVAPMGEGKADVQTKKPTADAIPGAIF